MFFFQSLDKHGLFSHTSNGVQFFATVLCVWKDVHKQRFLNIANFLPPSLALFFMQWGLYCLSGYPRPPSPLRRRNLWTPDTSFVFVTIKGRLVLKRNISHSPFRSADEWEKMFANWYVISKEATNSGHSYFSRSSLERRPPFHLRLVSLVF